MNNKTALTSVEDFIKIAKDRVCDWVSYHNCQPDRTLVDIRNLEFTKKIYGQAIATYDDVRYCGQYYFTVTFNMSEKGVYLDVIENSVES